VLDTFLDKETTMVYLDAIQVKRPKSYSLDDVESLKYPLVVKPKSSSGSKNFFLCSDLNEVMSSLVFVKNPIIQEFIPDQDGEYTVGVFARKHEGEYYIFEINPRFSSTVHIRSKMGFNDVLWSLKDSDEYKSFDPSQLETITFAVYQSEVKLD
jgi:carbamoyl-phosphate synthase large subunit